MMLSDRYVISCCELSSIIKDVLSFVNVTLGEEELFCLVSAALDRINGNEQLFRMLLQDFQLPSDVLHTLLEDVQDWVITTMQSIRQAIEVTDPTFLFSVKRLNEVYVWCVYEEEVSVGEQLLTLVRREIDDGIHYPPHIRRLVGRGD